MISAVILLGLIPSALSQELTDYVAGVPPCSTKMTSASDVVDLVTGRVSLTVPVRSKAGKIPFSFNLIVDSHLYNGLSGFGVGSGAHGVASAADLGVNGQPFCQAQPLTDVLYEPNGTAHNLIVVGSQLKTLDGSGHTVDKTAGVWDRSGNHSTIVTTNNQIGTALTSTVTDPDGAQVTSVMAPYVAPYGLTRQKTTYTDSLGTTVLTSDVGYTSIAPDTYSYTDANGATQTFSVYYGTYLQESHFQCPGILDFDQPNSTMPSSIVLPTGGTISIGYEPTGAQYPGAVTGRIASATLPSGGSITYTYGGLIRDAACRGVLHTGA